MIYKTTKIAKAFFSERERKGGVCLDLGMRLLGVFSAAIPFAGPSVFVYAVTSIFWDSDAEGDERVGDFAP